MKVKNLLILIVASLCLFSCGKEEVKLENVTDTFFGVKFGASQEEVRKEFAKQGLYPNQNSTIDNLVFGDENENISFGGYDWNNAYVEFNNGKFYQIKFQYRSKYEGKALSIFNNLFYPISSKYQMHKEHSFNDYKYYWTKYDISGVISIQYFRGLYAEEFTDPGEMMYIVQLAYADLNYYKQ